jgi:hypothetical protein
MGGITYGIIGFPLIFRSLTWNPPPPPRPKTSKILNSDIPVIPICDGGSRSLTFLTVSLTALKGATPFRFNDNKCFPFYELFILKEEGKRREGERKGGGGGGRRRGGGRGGGEGEVGEEERKRE